MDYVGAATNGYIHRNIEIYIGQPSLQAAKTMRGPRVVRALRAQRDYNSHREAFGPALRGVEREMRRSKMTLLKIPIMLLSLHSYKRPLYRYKFL